MDFEENLPENLNENETAEITEPSDVKNKNSTANNENYDDLNLSKKAPKVKKHLLKKLLIGSGILLAISFLIILLYYSSSKGKIASAEKLCDKGNYSSAFNRLTGATGEKADAMKKYISLRLKINDLLSDRDNINPDEELPKVKSMIDDVSVFSSCLNTKMQDNIKNISNAYNQISNDNAKIETFKNNLLNASKIYDTMTFIYSQNLYTVAKERAVAADLRNAYNNAVNIYDEIMPEGSTFYASKSLIYTIDALDKQLDHAISEGWGETQKIYILTYEPDKYGKSPYDETSIASIELSMKRQIVNNNFDIFNDSTPTFNQKLMYILDNFQKKLKNQ